MRYVIYTLLCLASLFTGAIPYASAQNAGFISSNPSGTISCDTTGNCGALTFTAYTGGTDSSMFENYCITTTPLTNPTPADVNGQNGGPCANYTGFNSSAMSNCNQNWQDPCTIDMTDGGLPAGTYTVYVYVYYAYCPTSDINSASNGCTVGSGGVGYTTVQNSAFTGYIAPPGGPSTTYTWSATPWGTCTNGTQTRTLSCSSSSFTTVANSYCSSSTEPATSQSCGSSTPPPTSTGPACTDPSCTAVNTGPGVTLPNCTPDASKDVFCIVVPTKQ